MGETEPTRDINSGNEIPVYFRKDKNKEKDTRVRERKREHRRRDKERKEEKEGIYLFSRHPTTIMKMTNFNPFPNFSK